MNLCEFMRICASLCQFTRVCSSLRKSVRVYASLCRFTRVHANLRKITCIKGPLLWCQPQSVIRQHRDNTPALLAAEVPTTFPLFVSPFAASRIMEQRIYEPTNRRTAWPNDVKTREVIKLKFLSMLLLYYIKSRQVSIRLDTAWIRTRNP